MPQLPILTVFFCVTLTRTFLVHFISVLSLLRTFELDVLGRAIAQAVSRRLPTAAAWVQTRFSSCGIL
jgi:hypothetical protein